MLVALCLIVAGQSQSAQQVYDRIQDKLRHTHTIRLDVLSTNGDSWDKYSFISMRKPNMACAFDGWGERYEFDGKTIRERVDGKARKRIPAEGEPRAVPTYWQYFMQGFESFSAPQAKVECIGSARDLGPNQDRIAIAIRIEGQPPCTLYVSKRTGLPVGFGDSERMRYAYETVRLDCPVDNADFSRSIEP